MLSCVYFMIRRRHDFATAASDQVTLAADEHEAIRWFSEAELHDPAFGIQPDVLFYACDALRRAAEAQT